MEREENAVSLEPLERRDQWDPKETEERRGCVERKEMLGSLSLV